MVANCRLDGCFLCIWCKPAYIAANIFMRQQRIHIYPEAPAKPGVGAPCNGCGLCCLAEPCPLGVLLTRRRKGACVALQWDAEAHLYRCGALVNPGKVLALCVPAIDSSPGLRKLLEPWLGWLASRWIAVGIGCDSSLQVQGSPTMQDLHNQPPPR